MWTTLPLITALALTPAQLAGGLVLTNVRTTYGELGGTRADTTYLPGDAVFLAFDIEGIAPQPDGKIEYTMGMEVMDATGKTVVKPSPIRKADYLPFGGARVPAWVFYALAPDQAAGTYTMRVTVTDLRTKTDRTAEKAFTVKAPEFGIVRVYASADDLGRIPAPTTAVMPQPVFVNCSLVGFARDPQRMNQPNVVVEMVPLDDRGRPTLPKPYSFALDAGLQEGNPWVFFQFLLPTTRQGKFTVRLTATDKTTNKTASFDLPFAVVAPAN